MSHKQYMDMDLAAYFGHPQTAKPSFIESVMERIPIIKMAHEMKAESGKCLFDTSYVPRYFFHGTTVDRLESIEEQGLIPEAGLLGYIYLATSYRDAEQWAQMKSCLRKSKPVTLYVDSASVPQMNTVRRDNRTFRCLSAISPEHTKRVGPVLEFLLK